MKLKRYIALALCALYIAATASVSLASMTCKCLGMMRAQTEHRCAECCSADLCTDPLPCGGGWLATGCDCDRHSTEIELYTSSHSDDSEKFIRCIVSELPPSLAAELPEPARLILPAGDASLAPVPLPREVVLRNCGLRAPPVRG